MLGFDGEQRAGVDRLVTHQNRAGAAFTAIANPLGAGKLELIAKGV